MPSRAIRLTRFLAPVLLLLSLGSAPPLRAAETAGDELKLVIIVSRHGVRSPLQANDTLNKYSAEPWPAWTEQPGYLTAHGRQQMELMGAYYRAYYTRQGLLTGKTGQDQPLIYFRSNSIQRTVGSARALGTGLLPGGTVTVHTRASDVTDPMFQPVKLPVGHPDRPRAIAAVLGRVGGRMSAVEQAYAPVFGTLEEVLFGGDGAAPAGKLTLLAQPTEVVPGTFETVDMTGAVHTASSLVDGILLEYVEGMPLKDVGWGRVTPQKLTELLRLHALFFDLCQGTFYPSQVQASNLASHMLQTMEQTVSGQPVPGAIGAPGQKLVVLVGHDTNLINLGGLLGLSWWLPGTQMNPVLPGSALVFELRQRHTDAQYFVRAYYVSETLDQMRELTPLTLEHPPLSAPIFIPGCSEAGPGFDAPYSRFEELLHRVIDPEFVLPGAD
jgi:4-phytase / acid phosphatase